MLETCSERRLRAAVDEAFSWDAARRKHLAHVQSIRRRLNQLAPPLRDVLDLLLKGKSNREIADELGLSVRSIEVRRAKVMQTMKARTLAALVRQALLVYGAGPSRTFPAPAGDPRVHMTTSPRSVMGTCRIRTRELSPRKELRQQNGQHDEQSHRAG